MPPPAIETPEADARPVVLESWRRSLLADIDPETAEAEIPYGESDVRDIRDAHPLAPLLPMLSEQLDSTLSTAPYVAILTDADGNVLWRDGGAKARVAADTIRLSEGAAWSESSIGTNGIGTCLATGKPTSIFAGEHLVRTLRPWSCVGAPIRDPDTGRMLGCLDLSGSLKALHPAAVSLVSVSARLLEEQLRARMAQRDERMLVHNAARLNGSCGRTALLAPSGRVIAAQPPDWIAGPVDVSRGSGEVRLADGGVATLEPLGEGYLLRAGDGPATAAVPVLTMAFLGRATPLVCLEGREVPLSLRRAEILALLALHPSGLTAEQLAGLLYGDSASPVTVRAEVHRLRTQLGPHVITQRPYRLAATVDADFLHVRRLLRTRDMPAAASAYSGPLLPGSCSPAIQRERESLQSRLRAHTA